MTQAMTNDELIEVLVECRDKLPFADQQVPRLQGAIAALRSRDDVTDAMIAAGRNAGLPELTHSDYERIYRAMRRAALGEGVTAA